MGGSRLMTNRYIYINNSHTIEREINSPESRNWKQLFLHNWDKLVPVLLLMMGVSCRCIVALCILRERHRLQKCSNGPVVLLYHGGDMIDV